MFESPTLDTLAGFNMGVALPAITLALGTLVVLLLDVFMPQERRRLTPILALAGITASFIMTLFTYSPDEALAFGGMFIGDAFTNLANIVVLGSAFLGVLLSVDYLHRADVDHGEFYSLLLISAAGAMFMAGANDLVVIFIGLELLSIPLYVMAAFRSTGRGGPDHLISKSEESGMKYFILGAFASAFFVYGAALIYGATGSTNLHEIFQQAQQVTLDDTTGAFLLLTGAALILVSLGFKVAVVPFHMWTPDVYEGAPTPVTAYMSIAAKVGGFTALLRILVVGLSTFVLADGQPAAWQNAVALVAAATMILGNVVAIAQTNAKRMLAYSSIAHAGYILMAVAAAGAGQLDTANFAVQAALIYLLTYMFTNIGAFAVVMSLEKDDGSGTEIEDFVGLSRSKPLLAMAMAVFMLSLTGIPLTAGFLGKWLVFGAAVDAGLFWLAVIGVLTSVISAFYYVRLIVNMYLRDGEGDEALAATPPVRWAIYASLAGTLFLGIFVPLATNLMDLIQVV